MGVNRTPWPVRVPLEIDPAHESAHICHDGAAVCVAPHHLNKAIILHEAGHLACRAKGGPGHLYPPGWSATYHDVTGEDYYGIGTDMLAEGCAELEKQRMEDELEGAPERQGAAEGAPKQVQRSPRGGIEIIFPYDASLVTAVKRIAAARFDRERKTWYLWNPTPADIKALLAFAEAHGFEVTDRARELIEGKSPEKQAAKATEVAAVQTENLEKSKAVDATIEVAGLGGTLRPFQKAGVAYAVANKRLFIADEMGLGKTVQALATLQAAGAFPALVVCPASLKLNWEREALAWLPGHSVQVLEGKSDVHTADITILNYDILKKCADDIASIDYRAIVFDESHYLKNHEAQRTKAAIALAKRAEYRIALTGTPILNRPCELLSQLQAIGKLDAMGGFWPFAHRYCDATKGRYGWDLTGAANLTELNERLRATGSFIRREKAQVLPELPAKTRVMIPMEIDNRREYAKAEASLIAWLRETGGENVDEKVKAAARAERLVKIEVTKHLAANGKLKAVKEWIESFLESGRKLVVFANHQDIVEAIATEFKAPSITGATAISDRQKAVDAFQTDAKTRLIVLNIQAGGVGLTLTAASDVAFVEQAWSPAIHDQAEDRVHRIGQTDNVTAYYFLGEKTIDMQIAALIEAKRSIVSTGTEGKENLGTSIVSSLMESLAGVGKDEVGISLPPPTDLAPSPQLFPAEDIGQLFPIDQPALHHRAGPGPGRAHIVPPQMLMELPGAGRMFGAPIEGAPMKSFKSPTAMLQWQYREMLAELGELQRHAADPTCPCVQADTGEYCLMKHTLGIAYLARETASMVPESDREQLETLAEEALELHVALKDRVVCGKPHRDEADAVEWSRQWRKKMEPRYYACGAKKAREGAPVKAPMLDAPTVKVTGQCGAGKACSFKVKAVETRQTVTGSVAGLGKAIDEARRMLTESRHQGSRQTFALGPHSLTRYEFRYEVVPAAQLKASHDPLTFTPTPGYPPELQPRLRDRTATQLQVAQMAAHLDPDALLTEFHSIDRGAPIVGPDMMVESGNGRVMALQRAIREHPESYNRYREELRARAPAFGMTAEAVDAMTNPILVRVRESKVERRLFAQEANASTSIASSSVETARTDAKLITLADLGNLDVREGQSIEDALRATSNAAFVKAFIGKLAPNDQARMIDSQGRLNQDGVRRMVLALFVAAFPGDSGLRLSEQFFESVEPTVRNAFHGLSLALGKLAQVEALTASGQRQADLSIGDDLAKSITTLAAIKATPGMTVEKYLAQGQLGTRQLTSFQEMLLSELGTRSRSGKAIGDMLAGYAQRVLDSPPPQQGGLLDLEPLSKPALLSSVVAREGEPLSHYMGVCNLSTVEEGRVWAWRPLRDFLLWASGVAHVEVCQAGMVPDSLQVTITRKTAFKPEVNLMVTERARHVPGMREVAVWGRPERVFTVVIPAMEVRPEDLIGRGQEVTSRDRFHPVAAEQVKLFAPTCRAPHA